MPKETFFNLPEEKRIAIEDAAIDEFSEHNLEKASINRIVERSNISKGSFYQYFEDKADLFIYLTEVLVQEKLKYISPVLYHPENYDFYTFMKELYVNGLEFASRSPKLMKIGNHLMKNKDQPSYKELFGNSIGQGLKMYEGLLTMAIEKGEVRRDIDVSFTSYMLLSMNVSISEYWFSKIGDDYSMFKTLKEDMIETVNTFIEIIRTGLEVNK